MRSYDNGGKTSRHLRRCARRTTLRPVRITRRAAPVVTSARSSATSWTGGMIPQKFTRAGQNIAAAAMLLRGLPEPIDPQEQAVHRNLRALMETAAIQQAESSAS